MADLKLTVSVSETEQKILLDRIWDIDDFIQKAMVGQIDHCWTLMQNEWITRLMNDETYTDPIPSNKDDFVALITSRADYKDRTARGAENKLE